MQSETLLDVEGIDYLVNWGEIFNSQVLHQIWIRAKGIHSLKYILMIAI